MDKAIEFVLSTAGGFCLGLLLSLILFTWIAYSDGREVVRKQAVERGYAAYCPKNGQWAWNGECKE